MARYKHYDYKQLIMVPVSLEEQLIPGTLEYAIHHVLEERLEPDLRWPDRSEVTYQGEREQERQK